MAASPPRLVWLAVVGLTPRLLAHAPRLRALAEAGGAAPVAGPLPEVTCTAQATALTGVGPAEHGIVGNGWFHRDTGEVRFWLQSNALLQAEPLYATARRRARERGRALKVAKLFWWFNQGADVDLSVTPKPHYGADGSKVFGIHGTPAALPERLEAALGSFPFHAFWGPMAGRASSDWIAAAAATVLADEQPDLTLVYLPHLDYDLQRHGPDHPDTPARVAEVDEAAGRVLDAAAQAGAQVVVTGEYGLQPVSRAVLPNGVLREAGLLAVRDGPFGEMLDTFASRAFAVCDHQVAHVIVPEARDREAVAERLAALDGVASVLAGEARAEAGLDHARAGDLVLLAEPDAHLAYPYWLDDGRAPDFARTVDIHRKPGYDPCELFLDPALRAPRLRVLRRLLQKRLGLRYRMDVVPLDPTLVRGSHGVPPPDAADRPVVIVPDGAPPARLQDLRDDALRRLDLA